MRIFEIVAKMRKMNLHEGRMFLAAELRKEPKYSRRRTELQLLLHNLTLRELRKGSCAA